MLERALILCRGHAIKADDISIPKKKADEFSNEKEILVSATVSGENHLNEALEMAKRQMIVGALRRCSGNVSAAAQSSGCISRRSQTPHEDARTRTAASPPGMTEANWV